MKGEGAKSANGKDMVYICTLSVIKNEGLDIKINCSNRAWSELCNNKLRHMHMYVQDTCIYICFSMHHIKFL